MLFKFFVADPDPGSGAFLTLNPGWKNLDPDKHSGYAVLLPTFTIPLFFCRAFRLSSL